MKLYSIIFEASVVELSTFVKNNKFASTPVMLDGTRDGAKWLWAALVNQKNTLRKIYKAGRLYGISRRFLKNLPRAKRARILRKLVAGEVVPDDGVVSDSDAFAPLEYMGRPDLSWKKVLDDKGVEYDGELEEFDDGDGSPVLRQL